MTDQPDDDTRLAGGAGEQPEHPQPEHPRADDVRALLAGLGDPGPMPPEVVARIEASLAQARRGSVPTTGTTQEPPAAGTSAATVADLGARRARRGPGRWVAGLAAAAAVVVGGGGALSLVDDLGGVGSSGGDAAEQANATSAPAADQGAPADQGEPSALSSQAATPFVVTLSGKDYRRGTVADELEETLRTADPAHSGTTESPMVGPLATPLGAQDCLRSLGVPGAPGRVDVGTFDGTPGFAILVPRTEGGWTAWVVAQGCKPVWDEPVAVDAP